MERDGLKASTFPRLVCALCNGGVVEWTATVAAPHHELARRTHLVLDQNVSEDGGDRNLTATRSALRIDEHAITNKALA